MGINPKLIKALADAPNAGEGAEMLVYEELLKSELLMPVKGHENDRDKLNFLAIPVTEGKAILPAFTHRQALEKWRAGWKWVVALPAPNVFQLALDAGPGGGGH